MRKTLALFVGFALTTAPVPAETPADSLSALFAQLDRCLSSAKLAAGTDVTVQFMLNRSGGVIGKPRITHAQWPQDVADRKAAAASIAAAFDRCLPAAITVGLGGAIAGRLIAYRLRGGASEYKS